MKRIYKHAGQMLAITALGTMGMGAAQAFEWQLNEDTTVSVTGSVEIAYVFTNHTGDKGNTRNLADNGSGIAFGLQHQLPNGWTAYGKYDLDVEVTDDDEDSPEDSGGSIRTNSAYFGVHTSAGSVQIGEWDGIYDNHINDAIDVFEVVGASAPPVTSSGDAIGYFSPNFGGFHFAAQVFLNGDSDFLEINGDADDNHYRDNGQSFVALLQYDAPMYNIRLVYDDVGFDSGQEGTIALAGRFDLSPVGIGWRIAHRGEDDKPLSEGSGPGSSVYRPRPIGSFPVNSRSLALDKEGAMYYAVSASYDFGHPKVTGLVNYVDPGADSLENRVELGIALNYNIADNFYLYAEHLYTDRNEGVNSRTATGLVYTF